MTKDYVDDHACIVPGVLLLQILNEVTKDVVWKVVYWLSSSQPREQLIMSASPRAINQLSSSVSKRCFTVNKVILAQGMVY